MDGQSRRHRSSTAASRPILTNNQTAELRGLADELHNASGARPPSSDTLQAQSNALRRMRQLLIESPEQTQTKDAFRYIQGFDVLLTTIRSVSGFYDLSKLTDENRLDFFQVIKATLDVLSEAVKEHSGNGRYFAKRVEGGGWQALEQALGSTGIFGTRSNGRRDDAGQERLFGCLFAFALGEEAMTRIFRNTERIGNGEAKASQAEHEENNSQPADAAKDSTSGEVEPNGNTAVDVQPLRGQLREVFSGNEVLQNPEIVPIILHFWLMLLGEDRSGLEGRSLSAMVLLAIQEIIRISSFNKASLHVTGALSIILPALFDNRCSPMEARLLRELGDSLISYGINRLEDAFYLFREAATSEQAAEFLLYGMQASREPPFIQFDLSLQGYSAIELPDIGRQFPPTAPGAGYTFTSWIRVDKYDPDCHTTIFGAFDASQTCFIMAYIEKDTRCLILQTSVHSSGSSPSIRFKKAPQFEEGKWYHIAVVHRRASAKMMGLGSSRASLYVNGEFTESMKCHFPASPATVEGSTESFVTLSSTHKQADILAFLGTPQTLAPRLGRNVLCSRLSMASFHLFQEPLSDELIAVHHKLGPRYCGNFQDRLGSFQTYRTSAELHVQNEILHPGREERSDIVSAIRTSAGNLMPENRILLSFSPTSVMDDDDRNNVDESQLIQSLSKESAFALQKHTRMRGTPLIINAAVPSVNDALSQRRGYGRFAGPPVVVVPQALDDAMWRIGGCTAVGIRLVQLAQTPQAILRAMKILLEAVEGNWRNCEAMESNNGFAVLAEVLRQKLGFGPGLGSSSRRAIVVDMTPLDREAFMLQLLKVVLRFVGYDDQNPTESLIINPLAYRVLLVDLEIWRRSTSVETQMLYYSQFIDFAKGSKHHHYNAKRFHRIRVVKRLIDALKGEPFREEVFPHFLKAFRVLVSINFSGENARFLALFVTYALHDGRAFAKKTLRPKASMLRIRKGTPNSLTPGSTPRSESPNQDPSSFAGMPLAELGIAMLGLIAEILCERGNTGDIQRFAKNVTNKWLLYLLAESDPRVVTLGAKILGRLLVLNGPHYIRKFADKSGGFIIMKNRLKSWWNTPGIWTICFAILFDRDVATIDFERDFDLFNLTEVFIAHDNLRVVYPEVFPVITTMLETGLRAIVKDQANSLSEGHSTGETSQTSSETVRGRRRTMSLSAKQPSTDPRRPQAERLSDYAAVLNSAIQFLSEAHSRSGNYREYATISTYTQELLFVLYPVIVSSDRVSAETELVSRGSALTFEGQDVVIQPLSKSHNQQAPIVRTTNVQTPPSTSTHRAVPFRRASSFVLISADNSTHSKNVPWINPMLSSQNGGPVALKVGSSVVEGMLEVVLGVFLDQLLHRKDFPGLGLFQRTPPGFQEHQAYFESYIIRNTISTVSNAIQMNQTLLHEPRALTNLSRFVTHLSESVFEGWFMNGADPVLDFTGMLLEYLQRPDVAKIKGVRLCTQAVNNIRFVFLRVVLLRLADEDESDLESATVAFIDKLIYWQTIILSSENTETPFLRLFCYLLYTKLVSEHETVRLSAANLWRFLLVQKPDETSEILNHAMSGDKKNIFRGFHKLMEIDNETFLHWIDGNKDDLNGFFLGTMAKSWQEFVQEQNKKTTDTLRNRVGKRKEKLKQWHSEEISNDTIWNRHEVQTNHWRSNVHASERLKHQRVLQDQQDNLAFVSSVIIKLDRQLKGPCSLFEDGSPSKWRLDETEGRNRMRMRIIPDNSTRQDDYRPKRKESDLVARNRLKLDTAVPQASKSSIGVTPVDSPNTNRNRALSGAGNPSADQNSSDSELGEDFEMVEGPHEDEEGFEDKNRKVMRSLQRGDQVQHVSNVSRIVGLEACEGLLILGKHCLYLLDDFFQRSDGEIVRSWQAPPDERDAYLQIIAGHQTSTTGRRPPPRDQEDSARHWKWAEVISISKRRFLFRDVALEVFFADGRSYLLTAISPTVRNELYSKLVSRAPHVNKPELLANSENAWRINSLRNPEEAPQTFGSRFATVFNAGSYNAATKKWMKGEISNFHYLMLVNTLAGRTFNDLTQYPVFPWVLSDYSSEELDLTSPLVYRDFTKPMGAQNPEREQEFRARYQTFAEMGDSTAQPPFHYGTHYSSAMIVASYLIRLQPFVQSYLLLQGGNFDHADRLFDSIEQAWLSASKGNVADVRELTPEFFYLPEFLANINGYNFGQKNTGEKVDNVLLPKWAKGDPAVFITKHREALESPHVSKNLQHWIDLVFGFKQRGEAAMEATNVFHHLSYHGAIDLDNITDHVERVATIGIIHNFGQTPLQIFQRAHPQREDNIQRHKRLDNAAGSLTRLPSTLLESRERVSSLAYVSKTDRLLCSAAFRHNIPPLYDRYMEWGFTDGSVRFYSSDSKKLLGLFEHLHSGQLTTSLFVDGRTLITAGTDCTVAIWNVIRGEKGSVELQPVTTLFGHRSPVTTLASSRAFSAFLSASSDGKIFLWDLNLATFVRELDLGSRYRRERMPVQCARINNISGKIMLCCGSRLVLCTLNGKLLLDEEVCDTREVDDVVTCCAFWEGVGDEWVERELVFTGHRRGMVNIWNITLSPSGRWGIDLIKRLNHTDPSREDGANYTAPITCILPMAQVVYTGDDDGRVVGSKIPSTHGCRRKAEFV